MGSQGWKWATLLLAAVLLMLVSCLVGLAVGGVVGFGMGARERAFEREFRREEVPPMEPPWEIPEPPRRPLPPFGEQPERPWLGVYFEMVEEGAAVRDVVFGSPADEAGLQVDDVIAEVDGEAVSLDNPLDEVIGRYTPGDEVELEILRGDEIRNITVELGMRPMEPGEGPFILPPAPGEG
ncbi:MAG: S1C family serine protease [Anaerolineales bacterium]